MKPMIKVHKLGLQGKVSAQAKVLSPLLCVVEEPPLPSCGPVWEIVRKNILFDVHDLCAW